MATNSDWTVVFEDKTIIKQSDSNSITYEINDDTFWNDSKWSNVWAIQYKDDNHDYNDSVEYRDDTPHATWTASNLGNFRDQFVNKWDAAHLSKLQADWDADEREESEKGARPTSYSSY